MNYLPIGFYDWILKLCVQKYYNHGLLPNIYENILGNELGQKLKGRWKNVKNICVSEYLNVSLIGYNNQKGYA